MPDFPKPGILFYDVTGLLADAAVFEHTIARLTELVSDLTIDAVAGIEARGFIFGSPLALRLGVPFIPLRKKGKLPGSTLAREFELEYGRDVIEVHRDDVPRAGAVLLFDDLIATGGTIEAAASLIEEAGASVAAIAAIIALPFLDFSARLAGRTVRYLQEYAGE